MNIDINKFRDIKYFKNNIPINGLLMDETLMNKSLFNDFIKDDELYWNIIVIESNLLYKILLFEFIPNKNITFKLKFNHNDEYIIIYKPDNAVFNESNFLERMINTSIYYKKNEYYNQILNENKNIVDILHYFFHRNYIQINFTVIYDNLIFEIIYIHEQRKIIIQSKNYRKLIINNNSSNEIISQRLILDYNY